MRSTMKRTVAGSLSFAFLLLAIPASAQTIDSATAVTLENVVGVMWQKVKYPDRDGDDPDAIRYTGVTSGVYQFRVPALPRVGGHHFFGTFSAGGALHYSDNDDFGTHTVLAPRIGWAFPWGDSSALWLRGGVTWAKWEVDAMDRETTGLMAGGEVLALMMPVDNVAIILGGTYEHGVSGSREGAGGGDEETRLFAYGFTMGMAFIL